MDVHSYSSNKDKQEHGTTNNSTNQSHVSYRSTEVNNATEDVENVQFSYKTLMIVQQRFLVFPLTVGCFLVYWLIAGCWCVVCCLLWCYPHHWVLVAPILEETRCWPLISLNMNRNNRTSHLLQETINSMVCNTNSMCTTLMDMILPLWEDFVDMKRLGSRYI